MSIPAVQTQLAKYFTNKINAEKNISIHLERLQIALSGKIILKNFYVLDDRQDTIFKGKTLETYLINPYQPYQKNKLVFGTTKIDGLDTKLITYKNARKLNIEESFIDRLDKSSADNKPNKTPFLLKIKELKLTNAKFKLLDFKKDSPEILNLDRLNMEVKKFNLIGSQLVFDLDKSSFVYLPNGLKIENLLTHFFYDKSQIRFDGFKLDTENSSIDMDLVFNAWEKGYSDFNNKVHLNGNIEEAYLNTKDLNKFYNIFSPNQNISINAKLQGTLQNLSFDKLDLITGNKIDLEGKLFIQNLLKSNRLKIDLTTQKFDFSLKQVIDLLNPLLQGKIPKPFFELKQIHSTGNFTYTPDVLNGKLSLLTELGQTELDFKMKNYSDIKNAKYKAHIITSDFDLSKIVKKKIDKISANVRLEGKGLTLQSLDSKFTGEIDKIFYNNYLYRNLNVDGNIYNKRFEGWFDINDPNMELDFRGLIDFSQKNNIFNFTTEICQADLYKTHWVSRDTISQIKGFLEIKAQGNKPENITGLLKLKDFQYKNEYDTYNFKDFTARSLVKDSIKQIQFQSNDIVSGEITGKFQYENIPLLVKNALGSVFANYKIEALNQREFINYDLKIHNKIISLLNPDTYVSKNTHVKGKIDSKNNLFKLKLISPEIKLKKNSFSNIHLNINNKNPIYNLFLKIDSIHTNIYNIKDFKLLNTTINDTLYLKTKFKGGTQFKDHYDLSFYYTMDKMQNFIFGLQKSLFNFKNLNWYIDPEKNKNKIFYSTTKDSLFVEDVSIFHNDENISTSGYKTKKNLDFLIQLQKINLAHLSPENSGFDFEGMLNGDIKAKKFGKDILPNANLEIKNFKLNGQELGDASVKINTLKGNVIFIDFNLKTDEISLARVNGYLDLGKKKPYLNASVFLQEFPVKTLAPLFKDIFGNIRGKWTGNVQIEGLLDNLNFKGKLYLHQFGMKILALNVDYQFSNNTIVYLDRQEFIFKNAKFEDTKYHTQGKLSGVIRHHNFNNWYLDLKIDTENLLVLDTPEDPQELYYGKIFVGGDAQIHGYVNRLKIDANMQTRKGTNLVLTLNDVETEGENDFIHIISKNEYKKKKGKKHKKIYEGLEMNFDLDITPDAIVKILMDQQSGSYLEASGSGTMLLEINTNGKFNMWGDFTVLKGIYNFKYYGVIDKRFNVEPGSYISWEGDPYEANLDIKAIYETIANPYILLTTQPTGNQNNMPVKVIIYLKEKLTQPKITFDLALPKANSILKSQIDYILSDPDRKNLQVISLLSFGNFINENDYRFNTQVAEGAVETLSERGLNLLNAMMSQDENFKVNLKYKGGTNDINTNIKNDPQVGLSLTTKINKRIYINGSVAIPVGRYTKSSIVGDMEIEVYLDKEGNLKFRFFNKQTELEYIGQEEGYTQGIGLSYQVEFDTFKEILKKFGIIISTK